MLHRSCVLLLLFATVALAHDHATEGVRAAPAASGPAINDPFRQLDELLPTPNEVRTASGAPGPLYWQQQADYVIRASIDTESHRLTGSETITYHNNSPHTLTYLWLQLDQNLFRNDSIGRMGRSEDAMDEGHSTWWMRRKKAEATFEGGVDIQSVRQGVDGANLPHTLVQTMMRIDLPTPLQPNTNFVFSVAWSHNITDARRLDTRGGYEWFKETKNAIYGIAQWYPRMCAYTDYSGWQNKQFIGAGEFTLEFGNFDVQITVPDTYVVSATGELQNESAVLTALQRDRLAAARTAEKPMFIITPEEALANEARAVNGTRTWNYAAQNVRDFAFAASSKFIWDAVGVAIDGRPDPVMAMSLYPNEAEPLWSKYSTHAVAQTLQVYSHHTFPYPYPVAISISGPVWGGMEYPMICFNDGRPKEDKTYSEGEKRWLIGVIIHEVGHNFFPMIVNSDERQWTWMDEGINTFCQYLTEVSWEKEYEPGGAEPINITGYMGSDNQVAIMTNSDSILQFGNNAYSKPATALNVLRESIMGRDLFDFAFREYARRWMFKRPQPSDLFRTLEDASGVDLDWFWRGWFYATDHVDVAIEGVDRFTLRTGDPEHDKAYDRRMREAKGETLTQQRAANEPKRADRFPELADFYSTFDKLDITPADRTEYQALLRGLKDDDKAALGVAFHFYVVRFHNEGGLVSPIPLEITYEDGRQELVHIPAEIWRRNHKEVGRLFITSDPIAAFEVDPHRETADTDRSNNYFPSRMVDKTFELTPREDKGNPMQVAAAHERVAAVQAQLAGLSQALLPHWNRAQAPVASAAAIRAAAAASAFANDAWGRPFHLVLSRAAPERPGDKAGESADDEDAARFATIHSDGPDMKPETDDDVIFDLYRDGRLEPQ